MRLPIEAVSQPLALSKSRRNLHCPLRVPLTPKMAHKLEHKKGTDVSITGSFEEAVVKPTQQNLTGGITSTRKLGAHSESRAKQTCRRSAGFRRTQIIDFSRGYVFSPDPHFENNYSGRPALSIVSRRYKSTQTMPWNHGTGMGINITHVGPAGSTT